MAVVMVGASVAQAVAAVAWELAATAAVAMEEASLVAVAWAVEA